MCSCSNYERVFICSYEVHSYCTYRIFSTYIHIFSTYILHAQTIFLTPPSLLELERRLRGGNSDSEEQIRLRIHNAVAQIAFGEEPGNFDKVIENCDLDRTIDQTLTSWHPDLLNSPVSSTQ